MDSFCQPHLFSLKLVWPLFSLKACKIFPEWVRNSSEPHPRPHFSWRALENYSRANSFLWGPRVPLDPEFHSTHMYCVLIPCQLRGEQHRLSCFLFAQGLPSSGGGRIGGKINKEAKSCLIATSAIVRQHKGYGLESDWGGVCCVVRKTVLREWHLSWDLKDNIMLVVSCSVRYTSLFLQQFHKGRNSNRATRLMRRTLSSHTFFFFEWGEVCEECG